MIEIEKYNASMAGEWDELVRRSRNGTFLHLRPYMDYHSDRFDDASLVAVDGGRPVAVLPANRTGDCVWSHQGLTYGGWVVPARHMDGVVMLDLMQTACHALRADGVRHLVYKPVPHIYHRYPAEEDLYALWRAGGRLVESNLSTVVDLQAPLPPDRGNRSGMNRARRAGVSVEQSSDWQGYWQLLEDTLRERYDARPVHTLPEVLLLKERFPDNILLYTATQAGRLLGGVVVFMTHTVLRCQYIASNESGRQLSALALLLNQLREVAAQAGCRWLDFGTSNGDGGHYLNVPLLQQKARLGGRGVVFNTYQIDL